MSKQSSNHRSFWLSTTTLLAIATLPGYAAESEYGGWVKGDYEGVHLTYPATFKKTAIGSQGDDNILKVSGTTDNAGNWAELALSSPQGEVTRELRLKMIEEGYLNKLPAYKGQVARQIALPGKQTGLIKESTFSHAGIDISHKILIFGTPAKTYQLIMTCPQKSVQSAANVWNTALASLTVAASNSPGSAPQTSNGWRSKDGSLALSYPATLKEEVTEEQGDHLLKASSAQGSKIIALDVYRGDKVPQQSLEELAAHLEQKYFETQKSYQKVKEEPRTIGSGLQSIVRESTFDTHGTRVHHLSAFISSDTDLWAICLTTAGLNANEAHQIWSRIASSISLRQ